jgi:hypothetical protein
MGFSGEKPEVSIFTGCTYRETAVSPFSVLGADS